MEKHFDSINSVRSQYGEAFELLRPSERLAAPTLDQSIAILSGRVNEAIIKEMMKSKKPGFVIEPQRVFSGFMEDLNAIKKPGAPDAYLSPYLRERFGRADAAGGLTDVTSGFKIGFVDVAQELDADPALTGRRLRSQRYDFRSGLPEGMGIVSNKSHALLQKRGMINGQPVDARFWTALDDGTDDDTALPVGFCGSAGPYFAGRSLDDEDELVRWRRSWMVPVS